MRKRNAVKKIAAVLASACLIVSMLATTVMAKPAITGTKGSLQINAKEGDKLDGYTFDLYKVADIRVEADGQMTYAVTDKYKTALEGKELSDQTAVETNLKAISAASKSDTAKATQTAATGATSVTFSDVAIGYYLVKVTAPEGAASTTGDFLVSIPSTLENGTELNYNVKVTVKTSTMDIQKKGEVVGKTNDKTVNVGDTINYTLIMKVPDTTGYDSYVYKVTDEMTKGLKFNNDIKVTVGTDKTPIAKGNYTVNSTSASDGKTTVVVDFVKNYDWKQHTAGDKLEVTYTATVTKEAITTGKDGVSNTAKLEFSNKPGSAGTGTTGETPAPEKPTFYTFNIKVDKTFDPVLTGEEYKKVIFSLINAAGTNVTLAADGGDGKYIFDKNGTVTDLKLDADKHLTISGLAAGTYYLDETATAAGYNLLKGKIKIVISPTYDTNGKITGYDNSTTYEPDDTNTATVKVLNKKGFTLPSTGGQGMVALVAAGICLMAAMAALMVSYMRKRRNA
ncbi:isopeptide-forming domain-containing fimbrial protein [Clostridiaceae bacterium AF29-16BH]|nr:isopeptide-forming domain-containing fimbrial protein [Clostridiaceae bacterium AF29-16BH]